MDNPTEFVIDHSGFGHELGPRLREERIRLGLKMKDMTARLGLSKNMWSRYEKGAVPGLPVLASCASHGFDLSYLLTGHRSQIFVTCEEALLLAKYRTASQSAREAALQALA